jgi:hypothetical protein
MTSTYSCVVPSKALSNVAVLQREAARSMLHCMTKCQAKQRCLSVNFDGTCCQMMAANLDTIGAVLSNTPSSAHVSLGIC